MRVIAGTARSVPLVAPEGRDTRPTTDRIRETLFNIIQSDVPGARFLDLFAGSGAVAIEAVSRGAEYACAVEYAPRPIKCIRENVSKTKFEDSIKVMQSDVARAIGVLERDGESFDIIYADPPYRKGWEEKLLGILADSDVKKSGTLVIIESALDVGEEIVDRAVYEIEKIKKYKTNQHIFLRVI